VAKDHAIHFVALKIFSYCGSFISSGGGGGGLGVGVVVYKEEPLSTTATMQKFLRYPTLSLLPKFRKLIAVVSDPKHPPCLESY
jgi:hypothetical protein